MRWCTVTVTDQDGRRHSVDVQATSTFDAAHLFVVEAKKERAVGLNDVAAAQDKVSRVMVMFSEGIGATTTLPEDIGVHALYLGIPIYPVATNYQHHIRSAYPRNLWRMHHF